MNTLRKFLFIVLAPIAIAVSLPRCASIGPISGGDKDTISPVLISSTPRMYQKGFTGKEIKLTFDEYIILKDPAKQFFISPPLETKAFPMPKGKSVVVELEKLLAGKTTYTVGFGNSVVDNNEGNPVKNLQLVFSTGDNLDTLAVDGYVVDAFTQTVPEDVKVMLYKEQTDSLPYLANPNYYAYAEKNGYFRIPNVPAGKYKLVAIADKNDNLRYDQNAEQVGFISTPVQAKAKQPVDSAAKSNASGKLPLVSMFTEEPVNLTLLDATRPKADLVKLVFSKRSPELPKMVITGMENSPYIVEYSRNNDTVLYWITNSELIKRDSIKALATYLYTGEKRVLEYKTQGLDLVFEAPKERRKGKDEKKEAGFNPAFSNIAEGLVPSTGAELVFATPPVKTDVSRITLLANSAKDTLAQPFTLEATDNPRALKLKVDWKETTSYTYKILPGAFVSASGIENDTIKGTINIAKKEEFGTIILKATGVEKPVILQLLTEKGQLFKEVVFKNNKDITIEYIPAGSYKLKMVYDDNDNQQWDGGSLVGRVQPEEVKYYKAAGNKEVFIVKKNWENEIAINFKEYRNK